MPYRTGWDEFSRSAQAMRHTSTCECTGSTDRKIFLKGDNHIMATAS
jgi:hypothetical protein